MKFNDIIQWIGAVTLIAGHSLNAAGPQFHPWNIVAFAVGTLAFFIWTIRVRNVPQMTVNAVSITICVVGLFKALS